jgi:hypothetical protein
VDYSRFKDNQLILRAKNYENAYPTGANNYNMRLVTRPEHLYPRRVVR